MYAQKHRLRLRKDFEHLFAQGKTVHSSTFSLKFINNSSTENRFAVVVSTKVSKKATVRNLIKRRLREIIRRDLLPVIHGHYDIAFLTRSGIEKLSYNELRTFVSELCQKARLS